MFAHFLAVLHDHKDEILALTSLFAVSVSLLATIIGPAIQMRVARLNAKTTILVSDRVKWIDSVQSNIATLAALVERTEFLTKSMSAIQAKYPTLTEKQGEEYARMLKEQEEKTFERNRMSALLGLSLDITPEKRNALFRAIERYAAAVPGISTYSPEALVALSEVQRITSEILQEQRTWVQRQLGK
jgi:hypothetical protein